MSNVTSTSFILSWDHGRPYFPSSAVLGFQIHVTDDQGQTIKHLTLVGSAEEKNITGLRQDTEYCMTVRAEVRNQSTGQESAAFCTFTDRQGGN